MFSIAALAVLAPSSGVLVVDGIAVGIANNGSWKSADSIYSKTWPQQTTPAATVKSLTSGGAFVLKGKTAAPKSGLVLKWGGEEGTPGERGWYLSPYQDGIFWFGAKPAAPTYTVASNSSAIYTKAVQDFVAAKGIKNSKPYLSSVILSDLDGNGTQEALVFASSRPKDQIHNHLMGNSPVPKNKEFSLALVRHIVGGKVRTTPLYYTDGQREGGLEGAVSFVGLWNLDGKAGSEIIVNWTAYEAFSNRVYQFSQNKLTMVAEAGDGS